MSTSVKEIQSVKELQKLAKTLGVRDDWHEPDEQDVTVEVVGYHFDNAGIEFEYDLKNHRVDTSKPLEKMCHIFQDGKEVAKINLAILFAFATRTYDGISESKCPKVYMHTKKYDRS